MSTIEQRVDNGIAILDKNVPDWLSKIDLNTLDLGGNSSCVLGQVVGGFSSFKGRKLRGNNDYENGFFSMENPSLGMIDRNLYSEESAKLTVIWKAKILELRSKKEEGILSPYMGDYKVKPKTKYEHRSTKNN